MICLDKEWMELFIVIKMKRDECRIAESVLLTPVFAGMRLEKQLELKELLRQDQFMEFIIWQ